ncbi:hydroxyacid oxidase 1-like, partial [Stegodyphus dumicola]|uniref:hydroxyacid oxidase 1-like n=1 Tax=Stegodyphus dumicola TaxID=202533 RepID=UPI0015B323F1
EDALEAARCGVSAVFVSNHGGRQIQRVIPTINVLEEVVEAVKDKGVEVYFDGGVRSGSDIFIAIALGANAVFVGRPTIWGLSVQGEEGVRRVLQILKRELLETMKLAGVSRVQDIKKSMVRKISGK